MKKRIFYILICLCVCAAAVTAIPCNAFANDSLTHNPTYAATYRSGDGSVGVKFYVTSLVSSEGDVYGVRFSGYYFGSSGIQVTAEIYSSEKLTIDFYMGDCNYVDEALRDSSKYYLTESQTAVKTRLVELFTTVDQLIDSVDECANTQYDGENGRAISDIYRYNWSTQGQTLEISSETYEMLSLAREMYEATDGAFNPAVYRLVDLWGFSSRIYSNGAFDTEKYPYDRPVTASEFSQNGYPLPEQKYIDAFSDSDFTDFSASAVQLSEQNGKYYVTKNVAAAVVDGVSFDQWLDLGGIAKGYAVDKIKELLSQNGVECYYVDAGSSSSAYGLSESGGESTLQLADPFSQWAQIAPSVLLGWQVGKCLVSSSGQYVRNYTVDGVEYSHIIDGATGAPAQTGVKLVSVVVPDDENELWAARADCLTTALTVMGKDKIVEFINGYLKQNNITVVVVFETFDGKKEICSNLDESEITVKGDGFDNYAWALVKDDDGTFRYDSAAVFSRDSQNAYGAAMVILVCVLSVGAVFAVVFHFVKGRKTALKNLWAARHDKPFKLCDIGIYLLVVLLIAVLFGAFFSGGSEKIQTVSAVDIETGEELFFYNVVRNEYKINEENSDGWKMEVTLTDDGVEVTFSREIDGEQRFNLLKITRSSVPSVRMEDAACGFRRECVVSFGEITEPNGVIVCSPNRLKIVTD